jgi:hypothetical protein
MTTGVRFRRQFGVCRYHPRCQQVAARASWCERWRGSGSAQRHAAPPARQRRGGVLYDIFGGTAVADRRGLSPGSRHIDSPRAGCRAGLVTALGPTKVRPGLPGLRVPGNDRLRRPARDAGGAASMAPLDGHGCADHHRDATGTGDLRSSRRRTPARPSSAPPGAASGCTGDRRGLARDPGDAPRGDVRRSDGGVRTGRARDRGGEINGRVTPGCARANPGGQRRAQGSTLPASRRIAARLRRAAPLLPSRLPPEQPAPGLPPGHGAGNWQSLRRLRFCPRSGRV